MNYPFVSVIIPVRNVQDIIGRCLKSLNELDYPKNKYEVIIADSNSTDNTQIIAREYGAIIAPTPKRSVCAGRNEGFRASRGDIVAFSDADCVMDKDWLKNSLKYFEDSDVGGVGGPNITPDDETAFGKAVGFIFNQAIFSAGSIHGRVLKTAKEVKSIPGCNIIFRRKVLEKVMPMDETLYEAEDYVMNQKIRRLGYRLVYTPDTIVWHYRRPTPRKFFKQMYHYAIGRLLIGKKDRENINFTHILAGLGLPFSIGLSIFLISISPFWFLFVFSLAILLLLFYFLLAWIKLKSFKTAILVPYAIIILFISWSIGFLRELFFPVTSH